MHKRVVQRCKEPARLAPVQQHERERGMFPRLHHEIPGTADRPEKWIWEVRKTADREACGSEDELIQAFQGEQFPLF